jgi:hypothetical protein
MGVCPAAIETSAHGTNGGKNAGRLCWRIAGTLCGGQVQGTYAMKAMNCSKCEFYLNTRKEEGADFKL